MNVNNKEISFNSLNPALPKIAQLVEAMPGQWYIPISVPVAQGIERLPSKQRVAGSNPAWDAI